MSDSLKEKTSSAFVWSFIDRGGQQLIQLVFMLILARQLLPDDFGAIAVLAIFTATASILQESGFSSALLRKKDVSQQEYTSVFYFNISIAILLYLALFAVAPFICNYYNNPILTTGLTRFLFLTFVFNAFGIVQNINLIKQMNFKTSTRITLLAGCMSGVVAVAMAVAGYGAWSLAVQVVLQALLRNILLWVFIKWKPSGAFSMTSIRPMFSYSFKLLVASVTNQICSNIYSNIIGKEFSLSQAGIYSQGAKLSNIPQSVISDGANSVTSPLLAQIDDEERRVNAYRKIIRVTSFVSFPVALMLIVSAEPIILVAISSKWIDVVPILQILAIGGAIYPLYCLHGRMLQYKGKPNHVLTADMIRNALLIISIIICIPHGVLALVAGVSLVQIISFIVASYITSRVIDYSMYRILTDLAPYLILAIVSYVPFHFLREITTNEFLLLPAQTIGGSLIYLLLVKLLGSKVMEDCINFAKEKIND